MYQQITIRTLRRQGKEIGEIARIMNCHRNTVGNILKQEPHEKQQRERYSSLDTYQERIKELLEDKNLTKLRIWQILKDENTNIPTYDGLCKYIRDHLERKPTSFVVQETAPGEEAEVDFGYAGLIPSGTGQSLKTWIFVMTLSYSRHSYYEPVRDQSVETFILCHQHAFSSFGGIPKTIKLDNLKAAVITNRRYDIEFNKDYLSFASFCNFVIKPCTPREPNQKGKVESGVKYVKRNFLSGRTFSDEADFRNRLKNWSIEANRRTHGTTKKIPHEVLLNEEQQKLQPLPQTPFNLIPTLRRKVKLNCHVQYEENYYSVPSRYVGEFVDVRLKENLLEIVDWDGKLVATHKRSPNKGEYITNPAHFPEHKVYSEQTHQRKFEEKMREIGINSHEFFKYMIVRDPTNWRRNVGKILELTKSYGKEKTEKAVKRALAFKAYRWRTVANILEGNLQDAEIEPKLIQTEQKELENEKEIEGKKGNEETEGNGEKKKINGENLSLDRDLTYYAENDL